MKKFFKFAAVAAIVAMIASCGKEPGPEPTPDQDPNTGGTTTEYTENLTFTLEVTEVEADKAKIKVEHNGTTKDTWYGFATTETDVQKAIDAVLAEGNVTLKKNTSTTVTARGLEPETEYTFVAVGIKADGTTYGEVATVEFTTVAAAPEGFTVNPAWTVTYIGDYEYEGEILQHVVSVESTDNNTYFTTAWPKNYFDQTPIETIADNEISAWVEYLAQYGETLGYILANESSLSQVSIDTQYGNEWYVIAIGADAQGKATGYYAVSDLVTIVEEEPTEEYAAWLGDWTFTGANGVAFDINFAKKVANQTYSMTGWEGMTNLPVTVTWLQEEQMWYIGGQVLIEGAGLSETVTGDVYFLPYTASTIYDTVACVGGFSEDGTRVSLAYETNDEESGETIVMEGMGYFGFGNDNQTYIFSEAMYYNQMPTFPITITPATKGTTYSVPEFKVAKKNIEALNDFETFGTKNFMFR